jgi:uncharacterized damage-inducible protein DinB
VTTPSDIVRDAFAHHTWANLQLLDAVEALDPAVLEQGIDGTYGPVLQTITHLVDADDRYLQRLSSANLPPYEDHGTQSIAELRRRVREHEQRWAAALSLLDAGALEARIMGRDDWPDTPHAEGLLLLQAIHHGNDHRSQVCSTLGALGLAVPDLDGWTYWERERIQPA